MTKAASAVSTIGVTSGRTPFGRSGNSIIVMGRSRSDTCRGYTRTIAAFSRMGVLAHEGPVRTSSTILAIARAQLLDPAAPRYRYRWSAAAVRGADGSGPSLGLGLRSAPRIV